MRPRATAAALALVSIAAAGLLLLRPTGTSAKEPVELPRAQFAPADDAYPYGGDRFRQLVEDSYRETKGSSPGPEAFYGAMESARRKVPLREGEFADLGALLAAERAHLETMRDRTKEELRVAEWAYRLVKRTIPKFSLERGFEFRWMVETGERQCLLQSVLIAGMLQEAGIPTGTAMVYANIQGEETNNGHVVAVARLSNGHDLIVDASDPEPFVCQRGLLMRAGSDYRYLRPVYHGHEIAAYREQSGGRKLKVDAVRPLDYAFVRSQFYFYRGERAEGGPLRGGTLAGLENAAAHLQRSLEICPLNPLPLYFLGRVQEMRGQPAASTFHRARAMYERYGWVPRNVRDALARTTGKP